MVHTAMFYSDYRLLTARTTACYIFSLELRHLRVLFFNFTNTSHSFGCLSCLSRKCSWIGSQNWMFLASLFPGVMLHLYTSLDSSILTRALLFYLHRTNHSKQQQYMEFSFKVLDSFYS